MTYAILVVRAVKSSTKIATAVEPYFNPCRFSHD